MMHPMSRPKFLANGESSRRKVRHRSGGTIAWTAAAMLSAALAGVVMAADKPAAKPAAAKPAAKAPAPAKGTPVAAPAQPASATVPPANAAGATTTPATTQPATRPAPKVVPADPAILTDEMVEAAIKKGAIWLNKQFDKDQHVAGVKELLKDGNDSHAGGLDALAVYALMNAGLAVDDAEVSKQLSLKGPDMQAKIVAMMKFNLDKGGQSTYAYGLRATALATFLNHTPEFNVQQAAGAALAAFKGEVKNRLKEDAAWGIMATVDGSYTYTKRPNSPKTAKELLDYYEKVKKDNKLPVAMKDNKNGYDNSNCQYGLLGVWSAADAEIEVPTLYWYLVANHWMSKQQGNGTWIYGEGRELNPNPINMTCAGLASMLVTHEYIEPVTLKGAVAREPYNTPIKKGLNWFETGNNGVNVNGGYGTYGVERVGLASGFKFFGQHDWYKELSLKIIKSQKGDGSIGNVIDTSYYLLFLSRGRHPLTMNKLRFDGDPKTNPGYWANRPRDAANLARYIGKLQEKEFNWQVINVTTPWTEWADAPILTISSSQPYKFTDAELDKIRNYVEAGGILYTQADGAAPAFDKFAHELAVKLFKKELVPVPADHPIYSSADGIFKIVPPPQLKMVTNGARILMLHNAVDASAFWQTRDYLADKGNKGPITHKGTIYHHLGANLFMYAVGKTTDPRHRLETLYVPEVPAKYPPIATVGVARLSYSGMWDPEPGSWRRFANWFQWQTSYKVVPTETKVGELKPVDPSPARKNDPTNVRFAHLTGTVKQNWTPDQVSAVKSFVESGGVLLVDITGGANAFDQSAQNLIQQAFPAESLQAVPANHPLLVGGPAGMENIAKRSIRKIVIEKLGRQHGQLSMLQAGKGAVIFSPLDITSGLLGTNMGGIMGYESSYSMKLMKNVVIWSMDGAAGAAPAAVPAEPAAAADAAAPAVPAEPAAPAAPAEQK
jgi:hypothetical protein